MRTDNRAGILGSRYSSICTVATLIKGSPLCWRNDADKIMSAQLRIASLTRIFPPAFFLAY